MTAVDEEVILDIDLEKEIPCHGIMGHCKSGEPVEWLYIKFCCNNRFVRCNSCKEEYINFVINFLDVCKNTRTRCMHCEKIYPTEDCLKHKYIKL